MSRTYYEWDVEEVDSAGDVHDHDHEDKLSDLVKRHPLPLEPFEVLVLVRNVWDELDGLVDRSWAYVRDGALPERFTDSNGVPRHPVPQRFHRELATAVRQQETRS